ncbi:unnamed protein product [Durusdinium trenchii]|uniref:Uncharacterized protein n=1 Tax=Durusdinium trenchii TaxID=1381693 RepID=A0ABP0SG72_9DINO
MSSPTSSQTGGPGAAPKSALALSFDAAKQVEEYIKVSKETSSVAFELACIAQDLGSLWPNKYNDEKSTVADQLIKDIVGDRIPYTFGKRASDTIPEGLAALGQFFAEDPRHFGVRLSALYTGSNLIQERKRVVPVQKDLEMESEDSSSDSSAWSTSSEESANSLESEELDDFDAQKWHLVVDELLERIQSKKEWETMAKLREMYVFKDSERAADIVHVEALAELNDEELRGFDKTREELETQVEVKQLDLLQTLSTFNNSLKVTTQEIIRRRRARAKAAARKRFSFANMDEVVLVEKDEKVDEEDDEEEQRKKAAEEERAKRSKAGELLAHISTLQQSMNDLVSHTHQRKLTLDVHNEASTYLRLAMEATEGGTELPTATEEVHELLKSMQKEAREAFEVEKKAAEDVRLQEVARQEKVEDVSKDHLAKLSPDELKVMLTRSEDDVQLLHKKAEELEQARIAQAKGGADRIQKAQKAVQMAQTAAASGKGDGPSDSGKNISRALEPDVNRKHHQEEKIPPHQLLSKLEDQIPAAKKVLEELQLHHDKFMKSIEKAQQLREQLSVDPRILERRISQTQVNPVQAPATQSPQSGSRVRTEQAQKPKESKPTKVDRAPARVVAKKPSPEELQLQEEFQQLEKEVQQSREKVQRLAQHFSKVMETEVSTESLSEDLTSALLEDKKSEHQKKQDHISQLREELTNLRGSVPPVLEHTSSGPVGILKKNKDSEGGKGKVEVSIAANPSANLAHRRASQMDPQSMLDDLRNKQIDPELMQELLNAQGENLQIQEQLTTMEDLIKVIRNKGNDLTPEERQKIKELFGKTEQNDQSAKGRELKEEKKKVRELQKQVNERRSEWSDIEGASKASRGLAEGNGELLKKVPMVKAAYVHTGDIEDTGAGSKEMEMETLQAAAAMARTEAEQRRRYSEILRLQTDNTPARSRRFSGTPRRPVSDTSPTSRSSNADVRSSEHAQSPDLEVDELMDEVPPDLPPSLPTEQTSPTSPGQTKKGPGTLRTQRRRSSAGRLSGTGGFWQDNMQVPFQVAVNMRRRHSLAAGVRAAQQHSGPGLPLMIAGGRSEGQQSGMADRSVIKTKSLAH